MVKDKKNNSMIIMLVMFLNIDFIKVTFSYKILYILTFLK